RRRLDSLELPSFKAMIKNGIGGMMVAHLNVPALDSSGAPTTLSKPVVTGLLRQQMGFKGVVFTDAMNMKGVIEKVPTGEAEIRAILAAKSLCRPQPAARPLPQPPAGRAQHYAAAQPAYYPAFTAARYAACGYAGTGRRARRYHRFSARRGRLRRPSSPLSLARRAHDGRAERRAGQAIRLRRGAGGAAKLGPPAGHQFRHRARGAAALARAYQARPAGDTE
nr:hypothetical protein [Tanacetum cinerariifolium]